MKKVPDDYDLLCQLNAINSEWYMIGKALKVRDNLLQSLSHNYEEDNIRLCRVIKCWKESMSTDITWETIIAVLEGPILNNKDRAKEIRQFLSKPETLLQYQCKSN